MDTPSTSVLARLREEFPDSSGRRLRAWLVAGRVRVRGEIVRDPRTPVSPADPVTLGPAPPPALAAPLRLVHEDESLLVIEKPSGLLTIGTEHERERTAYRMVWAYLKGARPSRRPFIVHRLDRETSGLLVIAKTPETKQYLQAQFFSGTAERRYVAIVEGVVTADEGTLRDVLVEERSLRVRPADPTRPPPKGRRARIAITRYRVVERRADVTRVALRLGTGRRHQIRVQMAKLGHPVVGDIRHGARRDPLRRLCLHATRLGFRHPDTGAPVEFDCAPPDAFASLGRPAERPPSPPAPRQERDPRDAMRRPAQRVAARRAPGRRRGVAGGTQIVASGPPARKVTLAARAVRPRRREWRPRRSGARRGHPPRSTHRRLLSPARKVTHAARAALRAGASGSRDAPTRRLARAWRGRCGPPSAPGRALAAASWPGAETACGGARVTTSGAWPGAWGRRSRAAARARPGGGRRAPARRRGRRRRSARRLRRQARSVTRATRCAAPEARRDATHGQPGQRPRRAGPGPRPWPRERPPRRPPR